VASRRVDAHVIDIAIRQAWPGFTLEVAFRSQARTLALFGDSGAGKSSVLDVVAGLLAPDMARVEIDGRMLEDGVHGLRLGVAERDIGYVFQDGRLFPHLSVRANLLYGANARRRRQGRTFDDVVALLDLAPLLARHPRTLSGGERQRVAIGRALLAAPRALLLDEPLTGLHLDARREVLGHLQRLKHELAVTAILVTHQPDEVVALADEVVMLESGRVAGQLSATEFGTRSRRAVIPHADTLG
jgi:molybdate transport system ATP-binding protein